MDTKKADEVIPFQNLKGQFRDMMHTVKSEIGKDAIVGSGCEIAFNAVIEDGAILGEGVRIGCGAVVFNGTRIGDRVEVGGRRDRCGSVFALWHHGW